MRIKAKRDKFYVIPKYSMYRINKYGDIINPITNEQVEVISSYKHPRVVLVNDSGELTMEKVSVLMMNTFCGYFESIPIRFKDGYTKNYSYDNIEYDMRDIAIIKISDSEISILGEIFKAIPRVRGRYISSKGIVYSILTHKLLKITYDKGDYAKIRFRINDDKYETFLIHQLVYSVWKGEYDKSKYEINHMDPNPHRKWNNDINNLELVTRLENIQHAERNGLRKPNNWNTDQVHFICKCIENNITPRKCATLMKITDEVKIQKLIRVYKEIRYGSSFSHISSLYNLKNYDATLQHKESCNKLSDDDVYKIYDYIFKEHMKDSEIAKIFGVSRETVRDMRNGKRRKKYLDKYMKRISMSSTTIETNLVQ